MFNISRLFAIFILSIPTVSLAGNTLVFVSNHSDKYIQLIYKNCDVLAGCGDETGHIIVSPKEMKHTVILEALPGAPRYLKPISAVEVDNNGNQKSGGVSSTFHTGCSARSSQTLNLDVTDKQLTCNVV